MKVMWIKPKYVSSIISIAFFAVSADVYAQVESKNSLLFNGIGAPWQFILMVGICVGLLVSLAPCVTALFDVTTKIVGSRDRQQKNFGLGRFILFLSCLAGGLLSSALVSAAVSVIESGTIFVNDSWTAVVLGVILILSALSLFGLYQIRIPDSLLARNQSSDSPSVLHGVVPLFIFGFLPVLVVSAIFAPLVLPASITAESNPFFVSASIFALIWSVLLVAASTRILPILALIQDQKSDWKVQTRHLLGILQIAAVILLVGRFPEVPVLLLWGMLLVVTAVYLGATRRSAQAVTSSKRLLKGTGIAVMVWGGVTLIGASAGNRDVTNPLPQLSTIIAGGSLTDSKGPGTTDSKVFVYVKSADEFEQMLTTAKIAGRPVMLDFYADWCLDCKRMDRSTFKDSTVVSRLKEEFVALKIDVTDPDDVFGRDSRKRFGVFGPPALVLFDGQGNHLKDLLTYGYLDANELLQLLSKIPGVSQGTS